MRDPYNEFMPLLRTDDLPLADHDRTVLLSILISVNDHRRSQVGRLLETLARQTWQHFEVLVADTGNSQPLGPVFDLFRPFLPLYTVNVPGVRRPNGDPSAGFRALIPKAKGDVIAIMQSDMLLRPTVAQFLYEAHQRGDNRFPWPTAVGREDHAATWVSLRPGFISDDCQRHLDTVDWHADAAAVETYPDFWKHGEGLSALGNHTQLARAMYPWWFVGSGHRDLPLWQRIPLGNGHAVIDFFLLNYRHAKGFVDITPPGFLCYHQRHVTRGYSYGDEQNQQTVEKIIEQYGAEFEPRPMAMSA